MGSVRRHRSSARRRRRHRLARRATEQNVALIRTGLFLLASFFLMGLFFHKLHTSPEKTVSEYVGDLIIGSLPDKNTVVDDKVPDPAQVVRSAKWVWLKVFAVLVLLGVGAWLAYVYYPILSEKLLTLSDKLSTYFNEKFDYPTDDLEDGPVVDSEDDQMEDWEDDSEEDLDGEVVEDDIQEEALEQQEEEIADDKIVPVEVPESPLTDDRR